MDREGGRKPLELLVLGPKEEEPLLLVFHLILGLKGDRSTTRVGTGGGALGQLEEGNEKALGEISLTAWVGDYFSGSSFSELEDRERGRGVGN